MNFSNFDSLRSLNGACLHEGIDASFLDEFERSCGIALPADHRLALSDSNGVEIYGGYLRLFGIGSVKSINAIQWNDQDYWKFAWDGRCSNYWCFAETAWGDQYAYQIDKLLGGDTEIFLLDCLSMTPTSVAKTFSDFVVSEFIRSAIDPYDSMIKQARRKFGDLKVDEHLVYMPSILVGGQDVIENVEKMNARSAMICNGDIAIQLDAGPPDKNVQAITPYEDNAKRMRLHLVWS